MIGDVLLAQKFALELYEHAALTVANQYPSTYALDIQNSISMPVGMAACMAKKIPARSASDGAIVRLPRGIHPLNPHRHSSVPMAHARTGGAHSNAEGPNSTL